MKTETVRRTTSYVEESVVVSVSRDVSVQVGRVYAPAEPLPDPCLSVSYMNGMQRPLARAESADLVEAIALAWKLFAKEFPIVDSEAP